MKVSAVVGTLALSVLPYLAHAQEINVTNNTKKLPATATVGNSYCSNIGGGVIQPRGGHVTIPQTVIDWYCKSECEVTVYLSKTCGQPVIATIGVDNKKGVKYVNNRDTSEGHYYINVVDPFTVTIEGGAPTWFDWLKSKFV